MPSQHNQFPDPLSRAWVWTETIRLLADHDPVADLGEPPFHSRLSTATVARLQLASQLIMPSYTHEE